MKGTVRYTYILVILMKLGKYLDKQSGHSGEFVKYCVWYTYRVVRLARLWKAVSGVHSV